jgi:hypothetical protein
LCVSREQGGKIPLQPELHLKNAMILKHLCRIRDDAKAAQVIGFGWHTVVNSGVDRVIMLINTIPHRIHSG